MGEVLANALAGLDGFVNRGVNASASRRIVEVLVEFFGDSARFLFLTSGGLSLTQLVITLLRDDFEAGRGLARTAKMYAAARIVGDAVRRLSDLDHVALERNEFSFNVHLLLDGLVKGEPSDLYLIYP